MDNLTIKQRKRCMTNIKSIDTKPELLVRKLLFKHGARYRLHTPNLPGKPDIVLPKYKKVIFVNGCFWHQHDGCPKNVLPKTNQAYWKPKLERNIKSQKSNIQSLADIGWQSHVIWECETKDIQIVNRYLDKILI